MRRSSACKRTSRKTSACSWQPAAGPGRGRRPDRTSASGRQWLHQFAARHTPRALQVGAPPRAGRAASHQAFEFIALGLPGTDPAGRQGEEPSCLSFHLSAAIAAPAAGC